MEVRVEKKKKRDWPKRPANLKISLRVILAAAAVCLLAGVLVWRFGGKETQAGYVMEKDAQGRYIFNVVEVVPKKNQAVLGLMIDGAENISKDKLKEFANRGNYDNKQYRNYPDVFYWEDEVTGEKNTSADQITAPFTLLLENREVKEIINNEIFNLYMVGGIKYDPDKTVYDNYKANKKALEKFNETYVVQYACVTPSELQKMERSKIQYLQIGGGTQASDGYVRLYSAILGGTNVWEDSYKDKNDDISFSTALELYNRALSEENKLSISISGYCMQAADRATNMYKLYQMLNYFDDPKFFRNLFLGKPYATIQGYIDADTGNLWYTWGSPPLREENSWNMLPEFSGIIGLSAHGVKFESQINTARPGDYIPANNQNILLYQNTGGRWYFGSMISHAPVHTIIELTPAEAPEDDEEEGIKVLEIEPSNSYWLSNPANLQKLATAIDEDADEISVTYVTPNRLNGMTVDLVAEYDLIFVGDDVAHFLSGSDARNKYYSNNGGFGDLIVPQTLVNGLLPDDYTSKAEFEAMTGKTLSTIPYALEADGSVLWNNGIKDQWGNSVGPHFLKNVDLYFKLNQSAGLSKARFSGNDLSRYMQKQLAEFVFSGQAVVVADTVDAAAEAQIIAFDADRKKGTDANQAESAQDARLYFALKGIADERDYYDNNVTLPNVNMINIVSKTQVENVTGKILDVDDELKPRINVWPFDTDNPTIMKEGEVKKVEELAKSNILSFNYEIELPSGENTANNIIMTVVVDRNGDGVFDRDGDGKTQTPEGQGSQNNATDTIQTDKVYVYDFARLQAGSYTLDDDEITGTFTAVEPVDAIEEFCEFQVIVSTKNQNNKRRCVWIGYMRPELEQKPVRILQITPYSEEQGGKSLDKNTEFTNLINSLGPDQEFSFDFITGFKTMTIFDFASACEDKSITAASLKKDYDLIIVGTDFNSQDISLGTDIDTQEAARVLQTYIDEYKCPVIFTNDAMSYVNSANHVAPVEGTGEYRFMTIAEAEALNQLDPQWKNDSSGKYRKVQINEETYISFQSINEQHALENYYGEGTVYLDGLESPSELPGGPFYVLKRPASGGDEEEVAVGYEGEASESVTKWEIPNANISLTLSQLRNVYENSLGSVFPNSSHIIYNKGDGGGATGEYYTTIRKITKEEAKKLYGNIVPIMANVEGKEIRVDDLHSAIEYYESVDSKEVKNNAIVIAGREYALYKNEYLALHKNSIHLKQYGYAWMIRNDSFKLADVAGRTSALYPNITPWNYYTTQSLRHILGMDRFAVTTDIKREDKRDLGSSRRHNIIKELQGFTNGALLEYAYLAPLGSAWADKAANYKNSIYADTALALGTKPRTDTAERLNDGIISHYPFEIGDENNFSDLTIPIEKNHAPLYQLDLDRELGEGKIDDVTVWYTLAGTADKTNEKVKESKYFDVTRRDAGNNYYLYSKGKAYYTGFSMSDRSGEGGIPPAVYEKEMQLFINTIYAALNSQSTTAADSSYEAVVKSIGTVSNISRAAVLDENNRYVCYYDEYDDKLTFQFRIQKPGVSEGETTPAMLGFKAVGEGLVLEPILTEQQYKLPEGVTLKAIPVAASPENSSDSGLTQDAGNWYELTIPFNEDFLSKSKLDGQTLVIAVALQNTAGTGEASYAVNTDAIHAEIRLVMRDSFDLD